jgi:hypothetical protein
MSCDSAEQTMSSLLNGSFVNIDTPHILIFSLVKLSFFWETYTFIVKGNDTLHRCDYLKKAQHNGPCENEHSVNHKSMFT